LERASDFGEQIMATVRSLFIAGVMSTLGTQAFAASVIDLSPYVTMDLTTFTNGSMYPQNGGPITVGGVNFQLATCSASCFSANPNVGQNPQSAGQTGVIGALGENPNNPFSITVPVNLTNVTTVYTLINSSFGSAGSTIGSITFVGLLSSYVYNLIEGVNVRDHYEGAFVNEATGLAGTQTFGDGSVRLDMQEILLPAEFANDTLVSMIFNSNNSNALGQPLFAAAVSVISGAAPGPTPVPAAWALMLTGLSGFGYAAYRRKSVRKAS
jgi:hypothetical protein